MFVGVQERLIRPQPLDVGVVQGLVTALCGRYPCLRPVAVGREMTALVLGQDSPTRVLMTATGVSALYLLRLCEEMAAHLRADLPLCEVALARAFVGRQVWFVPTILNFTAGWEELQAFTQKNGENPTNSQAAGAEITAFAALCHHTPFRHAVVLDGGADTVAWQGGEGTPSQSRLMARVLSAVSGYALADPSESSAHGGFKDWFIDCFHRPAFTLELGRGQNPLPLREFESIYAKAREMLLLSLLL